jgi:hypothetical protein
MVGQRASGPARRTTTWLLLAIVAVLLLSTLVPIFAAGTSAPGASSPTHVASAPAATHAASVAARPAGSPVATAAIGPAYQNTVLPPNASKDCYWENFSYYTIEKFCASGTQDPSIVSLSNGDLGVAYSMYTRNGTSCNATGGTNYSSWTAMDIGWSLSKTNGTSWGPTSVIGSTSCRWPSSSSPTFASASGGKVYGAFVMSNVTGNTTNTTVYTYPPSSPKIAPDWTNLSGDALGFVSSANNGKTWSAATPIPSITYAARPQIAVYGSTIYLVYINTDNGTASQLGGEGMGSTLFAPLSVEIISSTNGGSTWTAPVTLPGLNATALYFASDPSISVNATGTVAVAYATDQTCVYECILYGGFDLFWAYEIVVSTSTNNGTTWSAPVVVSSSLVGAYYDAYYFYDAYGFGFLAPYEQLPQTSIAYTASGTGLYVAYSGTYNRTADQPFPTWYYSGVFASYSGNGGKSWTSSTVEAPANTSNDYDSMYLGAVGVHNATAYVTFVWGNESYCNFGSTCSPFVDSVSQWVGSSTLGGAWSVTPAGVSVNGEDSDGVWQGWESSVTFSSSGDPVLAVALAGEEGFSYGQVNTTTYQYNYNEYVNVSIATVFSGNHTYAIFTEHNLTAGANWTLQVDGYLLPTNHTSLNVTNIPVGIGVLLGVQSQSAAAYRTEYVSNLSLPPYYVFTGPQHVDANFSTYFGVQFWLAPLHTEDLEVLTVVNGQYYDAYTLCCGQTGVASYPNFPWYFPADVKQVFTVYADPPVSYWNGTGLGSYNGTGSELNLTVGGPVNESVWAGSYGVYTEHFTATGLPSTSTYSFTFAGSSGSAAGNQVAEVANVTTGAYTVSDITATSSQSGWEYFGWVEGGTNVVVVPAQPTPVLAFADVNLSSPLGTVTFHANGIGNGTVWTVAFNGTTYSSRTPWLNVTAHSGVYPWAVGSAVAANASVGYAPVATGSTVAVTAGGTVTINYTSAYRVDIVAGLGGVVSGVGNHWVAAGTKANYTAIAANGYEFAGWTGTGAGSYSGPGTNGTATVLADGAIVETASFYPLSSTRFNLTFTETGIPAGVWWTVDLDGVGYSSNTTQLVVNDLLSCAAGPSGQYSIAVPIAFANGSVGTRYVANATSGPICTTGDTYQALTFKPQYQVSVAATAGGKAQVTDGTVQSYSALWASITDTVSLSASPSPGYEFGGWNGTGPGAYTGSTAGPFISVNGPVSEFATFVPVPRPPHPTFSETFQASVAFPAGTTWTISINGSSYASAGSTITVPGLPVGTYTATVGAALSSDGLSRWTPVDAKVSIPVVGNGTVPVPFGRASYWVEVRATAGGAVLPASGWQVAGSSLTLNASANLGYTFANWTGTGLGSYSGAASGATVTVEAPITEVATFVPQVTATTVASSVWQSPTTWGILALVGLLVGLIVGIAVRRLRAAPATAPPATWSPPPTPPEGQGGSP